MNNVSIGIGIRRYAGLLAFATAAFPSHAQEYPKRPITLLCWSEAGSPVDVYARMMGKLLGKELEQNVVIENRTGADGVIMVNHLLKAPADGYTIAANTLTLAAIITEPAATFKSTDLQMIARSQLDPYSLVVPAPSPFRSANDFVRFARKTPNKVTVGGPFNVGSHRVAWQAFARAAGIETNWIAYKGGAPALLAVAGAHVDAAATNPGNVKPFIVSGKVRVLAVSSENRLSDFPDTPTYKELGWDVVRYQWRGMMAKAGVPQPVVNRLVDAIGKAQQSPEWRAYLDQVTQLDGFMGPAGFQAQLQKDIDEMLVMKKTLAMNESMR